MVENAFGIAASRFRIFHRPIVAEVSKVKQITKAVVALHNFLTTENHRDNYTYSPTSFTDSDGPNGVNRGEWRDELENVTGLLPINRNNSTNNFSEDAKTIRDSFKDYFKNEGAVNWQLQTVKRC